MSEGFVDNMEFEESEEFDEVLCAFINEQNTTNIAKNCQHSNPSFAKFLLRRRHYPISAANLPTDTIVASPSVRCSSTRNGVIVEATKAARSSDPVQMGSSAAEATTGRSKAAATMAVRWWWRLWQQGRSEKFFSPSGRCP
ncbi:hypothetical protein LWI29_012971 [Acer saccharum]|uniref:Uncharacterized protein n=1 Tax=Acer saccharum TaxID=4024 RepID=A0AA39TE33_ACESA|nr:hypothetical protein LWI29_012971 [Acer saccharum]